MRACVIHNPHAGSAGALDAIRDVLSAHPSWELHDTQAPGDARRMAAVAHQEGFEVVVAAGGDGTVSEIVDGILAAPQAVALGILPLGTGNDLARTLGMPLDPVAALHALLELRERRIDVLRAEDDEGRGTYVANCAAGGFSGDVDHAMDCDQKSRFGTLAYLMGALKVLPTLRPYHTRLRWNDALVEEIDALNIVVANGQTVAGGWRVAPSADVEDGLLDVVVVRDGTAMELAALAAHLAAGEPMESDLVIHRRARAVHVSSDPLMWFNADGELLSRRPLMFRVLPRALRVLVGPLFGV